ncbi:MAG: putative GNAT superfamily acetyltransferase [Alteromonadaceae bacterium]|jgi:predicted GNAT superfamily acetyltransferase|tara:strand:- start:10535 stop:11029 length:495 start_codon:yes stop_codon:yes gene_type:complete
MIIRKILNKDIDTILKLNEKSVKVLSPMDKSKLLSLIDVSSLSIVIEEKNEVAGFLLALTNDAQYDSINYQWFNDNYPEFLYIDRIVISENFRGKGIGTTFYKYVLNWVVKNSLPRIFAEIDVLPPNKPSLLFHQKFGFSELERLKHNEHKIVSLQELNIDEIT